MNQTVANSRKPEKRKKRRLDSDALHADSHQSDICAYLSVILLVVIRDVFDANH
jgi:hypothetical protein